MVLYFLVVEAFFSVLFSFLLFFSGPCIISNLAELRCIYEVELLRIKKVIMQMGAIMPLHFETEHIELDF